MGLRDKVQQLDRKISGLDQYLTEPTPGAKVWEYAVIHISDIGLESARDLLSTMGRSGWELVLRTDGLGLTRRDNDHNQALVFKRPAAPS